MMKIEDGRAKVAGELSEDLEEPTRFLQNRRDVEVDQLMILPEKRLESLLQSRGRCNVVSGYH